MNEETYTLFYTPRIKTFLRLLVFVKFTLKFSKYFGDPVRTIGEVQFLDNFSYQEQ